ncbi:MAG: ATP-binding protein [Bacteroidota bacterium]
MRRFVVSVARSEDIDLDLKLFDELVQGERESYQIEKRFIRPDGKIIWGLLNVSMLRDADGEIYNAVGMVSDITTKKHLAGNLERKNQELIRANAYLDNFVHAIAHDLRAPIANLRQISSLLLMLNQDDDPVFKKLEISVNRLDNTVSGLISIIDAQKVTSQSIKLCKFQEVLNLIKADFKSLIREKQVSIQAEFQVKTVSYIKPFLESVIRNLVQNAIKYAREDVQPSIRLSTYQQDEYIVLEVEDNGIGIDLEKVGNRLFRPFKRFTEQADGKGIGLHLVKSMVEKNGGKIVVQSQPGHGTTFKVYLLPYLQINKENEYQAVR